MLEHKIKTKCNNYQSISIQNHYFAYFSDFSHIGVDFRILICEFAYAWRPCTVKEEVSCGLAGPIFNCMVEPFYSPSLILSAWVQSLGTFEQNRREIVTRDASE